MEWISTKKLMKKQFFNGKFWRYDVIVKYMFIEEFYKQDNLDDFTFGLYDKLYLGISKAKRIKTDDFIPLIYSFEEKGYDSDWPISVGKKEYYLCGGSHRFALALWHDISSIPIELHPKCKRKPDRFSGKWMKKHDFEDDMPKIRKVRNKIFDKLGIKKW